MTMYEIELCLGEYDDYWYCNTVFDNYNHAHVAARKMSKALGLRKYYGKLVWMSRVNGALQRYPYVMIKTKQK